MTLQNKGAVTAPLPVFTRKAMTIVYTMKSCPDCVAVKRQTEGKPDFRLCDIGESVTHMKAFLRLRDANTAFDAAKAAGSIGIPCFVLEDGTVTLSPAEAGLDVTDETTEGASCSLDGKGC